MPHSSLPPDDLPPHKLEFDDRLLRHKLDRSLTEQFYRHCSPDLQLLLATCDWTITTAINVVTLVIICPNQSTNWLVLSHAVPLGEAMAEISQDAKLRIYATPEMLSLFEIRVDELSIYQEPS